MSIVIRVDGRRGPLDAFVEHDGVRVFRTYMMYDGLVPDEPLDRVFTTYTGDDDDGSCFDIMMLPESRGHEDEISDPSVQRSIIRRAIDGKHLDSVGVRRFQVRVTFVLDQGSQEMPLDEFDIPVENLERTIPILITEIGQRVDVSPGGLLRSDSLVGRQSLRIRLRAVGTEMDDK